MGSWLLLLGLGVLPGSSQEAGDHERITAFLKTYCYRCHGAEKQKSKRRFDQFAFPLSDVKAVIALQEVVDQLNLGEMPPEKATQPAPAERKEAIAALTRTIAAGHRRLSTTGGQTVLRRLNRREYRNTIRDLFGLDMRVFDPTDAFPKDQVVEHLDNVGDTLQTSGYLLDQYVEAADEVVEKVFRSFGRHPEKNWTFKGRFKQQPEIDRAHMESNGLKWMTLYECMHTDKPEGAFGPILQFTEGVPFDGVYEIKVLAEAKNRRHPYDPKIFMMDPEVPFRLGIVPGDPKAGKLHIHQRVEPLLAETVLEDDKKEWETFRVRLEAGHVPRFTFPNGMINIRRTYGQIMKRYPELLPEKFRNVRPGIVVARKATFKYGKMPQIRIHEIRIRGPLADNRRTAARRLILGEEDFSEDRTREILARFADRAYRRPARAEELDRLMALVARRRADGKSPLEALKDGIKAVLCSPAFLYLSPPSGASTELSPHGLASRLSYFLWGTMPDDELRKAADSGALEDPKALTRQVRRMLADPKLEGFLRGFIDSWLNLRALGDMPPDRGMFQEYYAGALEEAMRRETQLFTRHLIRENRPVMEFLSADYTFANRPLAKLYGLDEAVEAKDAHRFKRVAFENPSRGGLLGHGSVLTVSANGIETSPVVRGVWLLENILGITPPPPPDDVPPIDPDIRGAKSIREVFAKHRTNVACNECHRKIDPLGFALENFDPIGKWRTQYGKRKKIPIDASGELPGGEAFKNISGLKKILIGRKDQFTRALAVRLLSYGCGRRMEPLDRPRIDAILEAHAERGGGFRDLLEVVVLSPVFRSR